MMRQILYISTASQLSRDDFNAIIESSERNNAERHISGFLLYNGRNFLQLVEGAEADLLGLLGRLALDHRHDGIVKIIDQPIAERHFPDWHMRRFDVSNGRDQARREIAAALPAEIFPAVRQAVENYLTLG